MCVYYLRETAFDCLLVRITPNYKHLEVRHGFRYDQKPVFSYKSRAFVDEKDKGLWVGRIRNASFVYVPAYYCQRIANIVCVRCHLI